MSDRPPVRVRYAEGQRLQPSDLTDEQSYLVELERRHNLQQHAPGIVRGLHVADGVVQPGVAIDGDGRLLVVSDAVPEPAGPAKDAWLIECEAPARDRTREIPRIIFDDTPPSAGAVNLESHPSFTALVAAEVSDPAGRASMQVGPASVLDRDLFVVRTASPDGTLRDRIAIDREGENRFTGNVFLEDYHRCQVAPAPDGAIQVEALAPGDAAATLRLRAGANGVQFFDGTKPVEELSDFGRLGKFNKNSHFFHIEALAADAISAAPPVEADLVPCGGMIEIRNWPSEEGNAQPAPYRGCDADDPIVTAPMHDPPALSFAPMTVAPKAPPVPGVYSILLAGDDPAEELRIDLGEARQNDPSIRMAIGGRDDAQHPAFRDWLQINGSSGVLLPDALNVSGSIFRGPIKADLSDPNFTLLLQAAWLAGLQSSVQRAVDADFTFKPAAPETTDDPWKYTISLTKTPPIETRMTGGFERLDAGGQTFTQPIHAGGTVPGDFEVLHSPNVIPPGEMTIDLTVFGKMGGVTWWQSHSTTMFMRESPAITFDASQNQIVFTNNDAQPMALNALAIDGVAQAINGPVPVSPTFTIAFVPSQNATSLTVAATYVWTDVNVSRTLAVTIELGGNINLLAVDVAQPFAAMVAGGSQPRTVSVVLLNTTRGVLKVVSIKRRFVDPGEPPARPRRTAVKLPRKTRLAAGETMSLSISIASNVPSGTRTLVLDIKYSRDGEESVVVVEKEITIP